jgi:hypothetical protein
MHMLPEHVVPPSQTAPHTPQLLPSEVTSAQ